jgi:hypothetical protein
MYDVIKDMEKQGKNVKNKAEARKKYDELTQDQKLGIVSRVAWSLLRKHYNQTNEIAVCGTILDPRITFCFFNCADFSAEDKVEIKSALYSMYDRYINKDVADVTESNEEPFGNIKDYFAEMGWLRKQSPTVSPDDSIISATKPKAKH